MPTADIYLTEREQEILSLLVSGMEGKPLADKLGLTYNSYRGYLHKLQRITGTHSKLELVAWAARNGYGN